MRKLTLLLCLLLVSALSLLMGVGCDNLTTETNNNTYYDSTLGQDCLRCHSDSDNKIAQPKGQWANSAHASPDLIEAHVTLNGDKFVSNECGAKCHTSEGFIHFTTNGSTAADPAPSVIDCFTCHMPHTGQYGSWKADTLRGLVSPAVLAGNIDYDMGKSNMCVICHQATKIPTIAAGTLEVKLDSLGVDGPHNSAQAHMLVGQGGFRFDTADVGTSHITVANQDGCLKCHFGTGQGYQFGEHTFKLVDNGQEYTANCEVSGCHQGNLALLGGLFNNPIQDSIREISDSLAARLISAHILTGTDADSTEYYKDSTVSADEARILFNYLLNKMDGSQGAHNADYSVALLTESMKHWDSLPSVNFAANTTVGCVPFTVQFADSSKGTISSWVWKFGTGDSVMTQNPSYTFHTPGAYSVSLTTVWSGGQRTFTRPSYIIVEDTAAPTFTVTPETAGPAFPLTFVNTSGFGGSISWDFGDTVTAVGDSVVHAYDTAGTYTARMIRTTACAVDTVSKQIIITTAAAGVVGEPRRSVSWRTR